MAFLLSARRRGAFLLEASIAITIVAVAMTGLALCLNRSVDAAGTLDKDRRLRAALEKRLVLLSAERLANGSTRHVSADGAIVTEQSISEPEWVTIRNERLDGLYEVRLSARYPDEDWPPLETKILLYQP